MKVHILFQFLEGPYGGGNQFLKALRRELVSCGAYSDSPDLADVLLFNSSPQTIRLNLKTLRQWKVKYPHGIIINRIDGPISLVRGQSSLVDHFFFAVNRAYCDGTIFQSQWSKKNLQELGLQTSPYEATIINAPDPSLFPRKPPGAPSLDRKVKLICSSWSNNPRKGFSTYSWLDQNLDFNRYEVTFVGNSPVEFANIRHVPAIGSGPLSEELRRSDVYITASTNDPCSNALLEALHTGLPAIAFDGGGHPEIVKSGGELFSRPEQIPELLEKIVLNYQAYQSCISLPSITEVSRLYLALMERIASDIGRRAYEPKLPNSFQQFVLSLRLLSWKLRDYTH